MLPASSFPHSPSIGRDIEEAPIRNEPVTRDEVRLIQVWWPLRRLSKNAKLHFRFDTAPVGTCELISTVNSWGTDRRFVGVPGLWQPLIDELTATVVEARHQRYLALHQSKPEWFGPPKRAEPMEPPTFWLDRSRVYVCDWCQRPYLSRERRQHVIRLCSDQCEKNRINAAAQHRQELCLPDYRAVNAKRTARRADARAGRTCAHCGVPFEAARSTRRFCSDICRVRASRDGYGDELATAAE